MNIRAFNAEAEKYHCALRDYALNMIEKEFKAFFASTPEVDTVRWVQYTPHDGGVPPSEFCRFEFEVKGLLNKSLDPAYKHWGNNGFYGIGAFKDGSKVLTSLQQLNRACVDADEVFKAAFGDGVEVLATSDDFKIKSYGH